MNNSNNAAKFPLTGQILAYIKAGLANELLLHAQFNPDLDYNSPDTNFLYHYTSLAGLKGIIESQSFYATSLFYLNDSRELKHGIDLIKKVCTELPDTNQEVLRLLDNHIERRIVKDQFVTSFSKNGDLLSQWWGYANNGFGVSIGLNVLDLRSCLGYDYSFNHVLYDEEVQKRTVKIIIEFIINFFEGLKHDINWGEYNFEEQIVLVIIEFLGNIIPNYKDPAFKQEDEFRMLFKVDGSRIKKEDVELKFRANQNHIVPYIEIKTKYREFKLQEVKGAWNDLGEEPTFPHNKLPIKEIIIGPSLDFEIVASGIQELLSYNGYQGVKILHSKIPYRI